MTITLKTEQKGRKIGFATGPSGVLPDRPTIVLIHGSGGRRTSWALQLNALDDAMNTIALELPGHGETPGPPPDSVAGFAGWVAEVLSAWKLPQAPFIAGHSLGGAITIEMGLSYPELAGGLILIGTGAHLPVNPMVFEGLEKDFTGSLGLAMKWSFAKTAPAELVEQGFKEISRNEPGIVINDFRACDLFDRRAEVETLGLPTLVVCGRQDRMTPTNLSEYLANKIPGARLELIDDAGHMVPLEQPRAFNRALRTFILGE